MHKFVCFVVLNNVKLPMMLMVVIQFSFTVLQQIVSKYKDFF